MYHVWKDLRKCIDSSGFFWTHLLPYLVASLLLLTGVGTPRRQSLKYLMVKNTLDEFLLATKIDRTVCQMQ